MAPTTLTPVIPAWMHCSNKASSSSLSSSSELESSFIMSTIFGWDLLEAVIPAWIHFSNNSSSFELLELMELHESFRFLTLETSTLRADTTFELFDVVIEIDLAFSWADSYDKILSFD